MSLNHHGRPSAPRQPRLWRTNGATHCHGRSRDRRPVDVGCLKPTPPSPNLIRRRPSAGRGRSLRCSNAGRQKLMSASRSLTAVPPGDSAPWLAPRMAPARRHAGTRCELPADESCWWACSEWPPGCVCAGQLGPCIRECCCQRDSVRALGCHCGCQPPLAVHSRRRRGDHWPQLSAWKAATALPNTCVLPGRSVGTRHMSDRECSCLTPRSGT